MDTGLAGGPARAPQPSTSVAIEGAQLTVRPQPGENSIHGIPPNDAGRIISDHNKSGLLVQAFEHALRFGPRAGIGSLPLGLLPLVFGANVLVATLAWIIVALVTR
jgi:hypothetical protein